MLKAQAASRDGPSLFEHAFVYVCWCKTMSFFVAVCCSCRRQARVRKLAVEEAARQYHQRIIDNGGSYDPQRDKYVNSRGEVCPKSINVGPGMAIIGRVQ